MDLRKVLRKVDARRGLRVRSEIDRGFPGGGDGPPLPTPVSWRLELHDPPNSHALISIIDGYLLDSASPNMLWSGL
jgi:hypothetical protein